MLVGEYHTKSKKYETLTYANIAITTLQHLVHAFWPKGGPQDSSNGFRSCYVGFLSIDAANPLLLLLLLQKQARLMICFSSQQSNRVIWRANTYPQYNERPTIFIERKRHTPASG